MSFKLAMPAFEYSNGFRNPKLLLLAAARKSFNKPTMPLNVGALQLVPITGMGMKLATTIKSIACALLKEQLETKNGNNTKHVKKQ